MHRWKILRYPGYVAPSKRHADACPWLPHATRPAPRAAAIDNLQLRLINARQGPTARSFTEWEKGNPQKRATYL